MLSPGRVGPPVRILDREQYLCRNNRDRFAWVLRVMSNGIEDESGELKRVVIYTDGGCIGNPGPGGYGVVLRFGEKRRELSGGFRRTTNNRMEIMAAIVGLETLQYRCAVTIYTDSQYLCKSIMLGWAARWRANGWRRNKTEVAVNPDLWARLLDLCAKHEVRFEWVKGHAGDAENECCDRLSVGAARGTALKRDDGYEDVAILPDAISFEF